VRISEIPNEVIFKQIQAYNFFWITSKTHNYMDIVLLFSKFESLLIQMHVFRLCTKSKIARVRHRRDSLMRRKAEAKVADAGMSRPWLTTGTVEQQPERRSRGQRTRQTQQTYDLQGQGKKRAVRDEGGTRQKRGRDPRVSQGRKAEQRYGTEEIENRTGRESGKSNRQLTRTDEAEPHLNRIHGRSAP
jgi:hypothetical protein